MARGTFHSPVGVSDLKRIFEWAESNEAFYPEGIEEPIEALLAKAYMNACGVVHYAGRVAVLKGGDEYGGYLSELAWEQRDRLGREILRHIRAEKREERKCQPPRSSAIGTA